MEQYEDLKHRQVTEFHAGEQMQQQEQQQQQSNPYLQKMMMDQVMEQQQQSKGDLQKDRQAVAANMPEKLEEKKSQAATPFSPEMTKQLEVIIRDKGNASSYYQPILKLSRQLLQPDLTEEGKVELFQELMTSMTFYLNHHSETETGSLAERRRSLCQRTIKGAMLFVAQAPPEYGVALKEGTQKLMGSERDAIIKMDAKELRKGFMEYLDEMMGDSPESADGAKA